MTVCIANVAAAISKGSIFDATALRRGQTVYLSGGRTRPMIPRRFSEGSCSLFEGEPRSVMAVRIRLDHMLDPQGLPQIDESKLVSEKNLSYADIAGILKNERAHLHREISLAARLAKSLTVKRRSEGAFVLYDLDSGWITSESGHMRQINNANEIIGHVIIQELMILTNMELARFCLAKEIPVPFRNHAARISAPPRRRMMELLEQGAEGSAQEFGRSRGSFMLAMDKASYAGASEGHYGLNLSAYIHGTSPIRRFADLITQRQIIGHLGGSLPYTSDEVHDMCERINEATEEAASHDSKKTAKAIDESRTSKLSAKGFEKVVKAAVHGVSHKPDVAIEFLRRLEKDETSIIDIYYLLLESGEEWVDTRKSIIQHLIDNPHKAAWVATVAAQLARWSSPRFIIQKKGEGDTLVHTVSIEFDKPKMSIGPVTSSSKKLGKQMALVEAFADYICEPPPEWPAHSPMQSTDGSKIPSVDSPNPIGALMEYCQFTSVDLPQYLCDRYVYDDRHPKFVVSCKAAGLHVKSSPSDSKKQAKKESARRAIQLIIERS